MRVGTDVTGVGVGAIVITGAPPCILLLRRRDTHLWTIPGGAIQFGERIEDAACRELLEETGMRCRAMDFLGQVEYVSDDEHWISFCFSVTAVTGIMGAVRIGEGEPFDRVGWFIGSRLPLLDGITAATLTRFSGLLG